jgi:hypothetical protein
VTIMGILGATGWLKDAIVEVGDSSTCSNGSGNSNYIGSSKVARQGKMVSCGGDGAWSVMRVMYVLAYGLGSSAMLITV